MAFTVGVEQGNIFSRLKAMQPAKRLDLLSRTSRGSGETSPFSLLTPTQFAELFPKYYLKLKPDVRGFYDALSNKQRQGGEAGASTDSSTANVATGEKVTNTVRAKEIYDYIRSKGVDHTHAVGIVNNMKYESNFNSGAIGDHGTSGGLFQHHASRFTAMKNYVGDGWQTNWKKQIDFAMTEGDMKSYLGKNYANARDASMGFTHEFERPANTSTTAAYRAGTADGYASAMEGRGGEPAGGQTPGGHFEVTSSGHVVPRDKGMFDPGNEEQCATLSKAFNPDIGRSSTWSVVPGQIKPGVVVATMRYNLPGGDRMGSGYHTGIALSAPDQDGNFLILDQSKGRASAVRTVNANAYSGGSMGGTTQFGIISSNGRLHDEQSLEALKYAADRAPDEETKKKILSNYEAVTKGETAGGATGGSYSVTTNPNAEGTPGPQTNLQQQESVKSIQTATIGDMMRFMGDMAGFFARGEGLGGGKGGKKHKASAHHDAPIPTELETHLAPVEGMLSFISQGEGGYNAINKGTRGKKQLGSTQNANFGGKSLSEMTVGEIMEKQRGSVKSGREIFAAGRYQIIPDTMKRAVALAGISKDAIFNKETQDKLGMALIQGRKHLNDYLTGKSNDIRAAQIDASEEWSSFPHPDTGKSYYGGPNKAHHTVEAVRNAMVAARNEIAARPKATQYASAKPSAPTASVQPVTQAPPRGWYDKLIDWAKGKDTSVASEKPKAEPVSTPNMPSMLDKTRIRDVQPGFPDPPKTLDKELMNPESVMKNKQTFNMQQSPADRPSNQLAIDKFLDRKTAEFPSPSLERHAFSIRQQEPTVGANFMHMGSNPT